MKARKPISRSTAKSIIVAAMRNRGFLTVGEVTKLTKLTESTVLNCLTQEPDFSSRTVDYIFTEFALKETL